MIVGNRIVFGAGLGLVISLAAGCATVLETQPQRLAHVISEGAQDIIDKKLSCDNVKLAFQGTEQSGSQWFDSYAASGCGVETNLVIMVVQPGGSDRTFYSVTLGASEDEFKTASENQLKRTAAFDLGCTEVAYTMLDALIGKNHGSFQSRIGASGCGKKATYKSACRLQGLKDGKHDIVCESVANSAGAN